MTPITTNMTLDWLKNIRSKDKPFLLLYHQKAPHRNWMTEEKYLTLFDDKTFDPTDVGVHLKAQEFNNMIADPNTILVDMRNHYETEIGHFENAMIPDVDTFRDSLEKIEKDINQQIFNNTQVTHSVINKEEAINKGAIAIFGEKYLSLIHI